MTTSGTGRLHRFRAQRQPELVDRWGPEAAAKFDRVGTLYSIGGFGAVAMLVMFLASSAAGWQGIGAVALAVAFIVFVPAMAVGGALMFSTTNLICWRYGIDPRSKPPLSFKALKTAGGFDEWLVAHGRQSPPAPKSGSQP